MDIRANSAVAVVDKLNGLITLNNDRILGYQQAVKDTEGQELQTLFSEMLNESINFAENLGGYVRELGGSPPIEGTAGGNLHQSWINLKAALLGKDRIAVLSSCAFADSAAVAAYQEALALEDIRQDQELRGVLQRQKINLEESLKIIESIKVRLQRNKTESQKLMK